MSEEVETQDVVDIPGFNICLVGADVTSFDTCFEYGSGSSDRSIIRLERVVIDSLLATFSLLSKQGVC